MSPQPHRASLGIALALLTALVSTIAAARPPAAIGRIVATEATAEVVPAQIVLPSAANGILVVTRCTSCPPESLVASTSTRWLIGKDTVDLARMRAHLAANPSAVLAVSYSRDRRELRRVHAAVR